MNLKRIPVAILGATGTVGQRFVQLLENHPWFEVKVVTGSDRTVGQRYGEGVNWKLLGDAPASVRDLVVQPTAPNLDVPVVFSALPTAEAKEHEPQFAAAGYAVITNTSVYRLAPDVPLLIPELNPDHTDLIATQKTNNGWSGFIVASPNCSTTSAILPLKIWHDTFALTAVIMVTMQAISGAGYPGVSAMDIMDNVIPYIGGEDYKLENEPKKLLGKVVAGQMELADVKISAQANRVPVYEGHLASVSVGVQHKPSVDEAIATLKAWCPPAICKELPSSPQRLLVYRHEPERPQPRLDRDTGDGLSWTVGKVRECEVLDLRYLALTHNTLRGAASGAVLNGELLYVQGYLG